MGDIAVDCFLQTLKDLIIRSNLDFIRDKRPQLQSLTEEIQYLRGFLKTTEKKRNEHPEVMDLVMQIRDVVYETENIIERFVVQVSKANDSLVELQDHLLFDLKSVEKGIEALRAKVEHIIDKDEYDIKGVAVNKFRQSSLGTGGGSGSSGGRNTYKVGEEKMVIGFEHEVTALMRKLHDIGDHGKLEIISIIGTGGGGKTTLAIEVYDHPLTVEKFEIRAWVNVSQDYNKTMKRNLLITILESALPKDREDKRTISDIMLGEKVIKCLKGKKYLIVMDDMWDLEPWDDIQRSFPRESNGSKVLFTSRQRVQPNGIHYVCHRLGRLSQSSSWDLLQKKVFKKEQCPQKLQDELVDIGMQIINKCERLPLAIVAVAGILTMEDKKLDVWVKVAKHLSSIIAKDEEGCMEILELSYNHLPLHLKACFLYIGAHPEDYEVKVRELIWLWIAEGFIQQSDVGKSLEAIAEDHLISLIDRNLVMAARERSNGKLKACRIHDLLRKLCLKKGKEDNFFVQNYEDDPFSPSITNNHRRLFIGSQFLKKFSSPCATNLRSFLCPTSPDHDEYFEEENFSFFVENFELLRVLYFYSAASIGEIQKGDLAHLRYLALALPTEEQNHRAPGCFHYLLNLEILNLEVAWGKISLPRDIFKMVKLRHLYTRRGTFTYHHVSHNEDGENMLDSLQSLGRICICEDCLRFLKRIPNLRKLGLSGLCTEWDCDLMLPNLEFLKYLEILSLSGGDNRERVASTDLKLPSTLTQLNLMQTHLEWEKLSTILQTLKSLEVLKLLTDACSGTVWDTTELEEGFSRLKYLRLHYLDIEDWRASEEQFPRLEVLVIKSCHNLHEIPIEFANLYELREIKVEDSSLFAEAAARKIQQQQRDDKGDEECLKLFARDNANQSSYW